jgi:hypothetical protein
MNQMIRLWGMIRVIRARISCVTCWLIGIDRAIPFCSLLRRRWKMRFVLCSVSLYLQHTHVTSHYDRWERERDGIVSSWLDGAVHSGLPKCFFFCSFLTRRRERRPRRSTGPAGARPDEFRVSPIKSSFFCFLFFCFSLKIKSEKEFHPSLI